MLTKEESRENLVANLRRILGDRGMSVAELARRSGVAKSSVYNVLDGYYDPSAYNLKCIADALDADMDKLLEPPPVALSKNSA